MKPEEMVDIILDGNYNITKNIEKSLSKFLGNVSEKVHMNPDDEECIGEDCGKTHREAEENEIEEEPKEVKKSLDSIEKEVMESIDRLLEKDSAYQKFFRKELADFGVTSPSQLDDAKKKEFFNHIDKEWKAKKESD